MNCIYSKLTLPCIFHFPSTVFDAHSTYVRPLAVSALATSKVQFCCIKTPINQIQNNQQRTELILLHQHFISGHYIKCLLWCLFQGWTHLDHPVDVWFRPAVRSLAGQLEWFPLLHSLRDRGLLLEVVQDGRAHEHGVRRRRTPFILRKAHVLAWTRGGMINWLRIHNCLVFTLRYPAVAPGLAFRGVFRKKCHLPFSWSCQKHFNVDRRHFHLLPHCK